MVSEVQRNEFSMMVESLAMQDDIQYIEALAQIVEDNEVDIDSVNKLLSKSLRERITVEGQRLFTVKGTPPTSIRNIFK